MSTDGATLWLNCSWSSFLKMGYSQPLFCLFSSFQPSNTIFTANKCSSSIRCQDSNPWPSEHASPPITTRLGLPLSWSSLLEGDEGSYLPLLSVVIFVIKWKNGDSARRTICSSSQHGTFEVTNQWPSVTRCWRKK